MGSRTASNDRYDKMKQQALSSFIWSVADLLREDFKQSEYGKVILPFTALCARWLGGLWSVSYRYSATPIISTRKTVFVTVLGLWSLCSAVSASANTDRTFVCKFTEYDWHHIDGARRLIPKRDGKDEFLFTIPQQLREGASNTGTYRNLVGGWSGQILITVGRSRITLIEKTESDNAFIATIFVNENILIPHKSILTVHAYNFGIQSMVGECR